MNYDSKTETLALFIYLYGAIREAYHDHKHAIPHGRIRPPRPSHHSIK